MTCSHCKKRGHTKRTCPKLKKLRAAGARGGRAKSAKKTAAVRANGQKGGRPITHRYFELFAELEEPPDDTLQRISWAQQIAAVCLRETMQGRGNEGLNDQCRKICHTLAELTPKERLYKAEAAIMGDANALKKKPKSTGARTQQALPSKGPMR